MGKSEGKIIRERSRGWEYIIKVDFGNVWFGDVEWIDSGQVPVPLCCELGNELSY